MRSLQDAGMLDADTPEKTSGHRVAAAWHPPETIGPEAPVVSSTDQ